MKEVGPMAGSCRGALETLPSGLGSTPPRPCVPSRSLGWPSKVSQERNACMPKGAGSGFDSHHLRHIHNHKVQESQRGSMPKFIVISTFAKTGPSMFVDTVEATTAREALGKVNKTLDDSGNPRDRMAWFGDRKDVLVFNEDLELEIE